MPGTLLYHLRGGLRFNCLGHIAEAIQYRSLGRLLLR